jgi:hypothetical protein
VSADLTVRFQTRARSELSGVPDLARVLFKPRNGEPWTRDDRAFLRRELAALARRWAPGFFLFLLPGGLLLAPAYAWYLDRRRRAVIRVGGHRLGDPTPAQALAALAART